MPPDLGEVSEDCLYLNVWSPTLRDNRKRPVMVYIHGGAYSSGSVTNTLYDGVNLCGNSEAGGDVVVVTVNHRLNLFGYLYLADIVSAPPAVLLPSTTDSLRWPRILRRPPAPGR